MANEQFWVLKQRSVTRVWIDDELCIRNILLQDKRIYRWYHDVGVAIDDQCRLPDIFQISVKLSFRFTPVADGGSLSLKSLYR